MVEVSMLVPYRADGGHRDRILEWVLKRHRQLFPRFEIVLAEDDAPVFWKARALNRAAGRAKGRVFIIADADSAINPNQVRRALELMDRHPWVVPFARYYKLTENATARVLKTPPRSRIALKPGDIQKTFTNSVGGMLVVPKAAFYAAGGLDERFRGWGAEDTAFGFALDTMWGPRYRMRGEICHLWHPQTAQRESMFQSDRFELNRALMLRYEAAWGNPEKMKQLIGVGGHAGNR